MGCSINPIDVEIAQMTSQIRAKYDIKVPDAIQIASGIIHDCDTFLTNDSQLKKVKEINVLTLDDIL